MDQIQKNERKPDYEQVRQFFFRTGINVLPCYHPDHIERVQPNLENQKTRLFPTAQ